MFDYPVSLQLPDKLCVVVGGGSVGLRKVRGLLDAGANKIRVVEPHPDNRLASLAGVELIRRSYRKGDLLGAFLAFAATNDRRVNTRVAQEAARLGVLVNVADASADGTFTLPACLRRGDLLVAVSTGGGSPSLAALVRDEVAESLGEEWAVVLQIAVALRQNRLTGSKKDEYNQSVLRRLLQANLCALIAARDRSGIDRQLRQHFGDGVSLAGLGVDLPSGTS